MRVLAYPTDEAAVGCYRVIWPLEQLQAHGHECVSPPVVEERLSGPVTAGGPPTHVKVVEVTPELFDDPVDVTVVQCPRYGSALKLIMWAKQAGSKVVVEVDDYYHGVDRRMPATARWPADQMLRFEQALSHADLVTVPTVKLADLYRRFNGNVKVLPNRLKWAMWENIEAPPVHDRLRVGWMGNSSWHPDVVDVLRGVIGPWLAANPDVDFVVVGDVASVHDKLGVPDGQRRTVPQFKFGDVARVLNEAGVDVGLVPLAHTDFNDAKSCLKGMEYAACSIPFIASPTVEYKRLVQMAPVGMIARTPPDWRRALDLLVKDRPTREAMSENGRVLASKLTIENAWTMWEDAYLSVM